MKKSLLLIILLTVLLLVIPAFGDIEITIPWHIRVSTYGLSNQHIAGDTFRVEIMFTNLESEPMKNVSAEIFYPEGVSPLLAKFYRRKVSRFPWEGHFIDFDKRVIKLSFPYEIRGSPEKFYAFFVAEKYGTADFDFTIRWQGKDSIFYERTKNELRIILPQSVAEKLPQEKEYEAEKAKPTEFPEIEQGGEEKKVTESAEIRIFQRNPFMVVSVTLSLVVLILFVILAVQTGKRLKKLDKRITILKEIQKKMAMLSLEAPTKPEKRKKRKKKDKEKEEAQE